LEDITMKKTTKPADDVVKQHQPLRRGTALNVSARQAELSDADLGTVTGGKPASSFLMKSCASGVHFKEARITL
jgi:hypothetical protein